MKKLIGILAAIAICFCIVQPAVAAPAYSIVFEWYQDEADIPNLAGWDIHMLVPGQSDQVVNIPYVEGSTEPFTATETFTIPGDSGTEVTRTFFCVAKSKNGRDAAPSNTHDFTFQIPFDDVGPAGSFKINGAVLVIVE